MRPSILGLTGRHLWILLLAAVLLSGAAGRAQQGSLTGRGNGANDAYLQRQLRSLESHDASSPEAAGMQLRRARRDLVVQSRGMAFTAEQARINRGLDRVGRELEQQQLDAATAQAPAKPRGERLPGTIAQDPVLPSFGGTTTLGRLVGRAEAALAAGQSAQARSDLATARSLVGSVDTTSPAEKQALSALQGRMAAIDTRLADKGG
ncbi:MAG: hypothetical protein ACJ8H8_09820 [Geminicoccaceae bacterium]